MTGSLNRGKIWSWAVSLLLATILLGIALRGVDWPRIGKTIAGAQWRFLAAATGVTCISYFMRALRWRILLNAEASLPVAPVFWANMAGYAGNTFLPARAGELIRTLLIRGRSSLSTPYVLTTALSERLMDALALVLCSALLLLGIHSKPAWLESVSRTMAFAAAVGTLAVFVLPHFDDCLDRAIGRAPLPQALRTRLQKASSQVLLGLRAFHHFGRVAGFVLLTAGIWFLDALSTILGANGLGLHFSFSIAMLLIAGMGLGSSLPSTPGYVGIYQFVAVSVLTPFGVPKDAALAYIFVAQALGAAVTLVLGLPGLYQSRRRDPQRTGAFPRPLATEPMDAQMGIRSTSR